MALSSRVMLNGVASLAVFATGVFVNLLITPLLLARFGETLFGVLSVLNRLSSYLTAVDGRPSQALKWRVASQQHSTDDYDKKEDVGSAIGIWFATLPLLLICGSILVWFSPYATGAPTDTYLMLRITSAVLVGGFLLSGLIEIPGAVLRGMNVEYRSFFLLMAITIVNGWATWVLVSKGGGLPTVAIIRVLGGVLTGIGTYILAKAYVPWFGARCPKKGKLLQFGRLTIWFMIWGVSFRLLMETDILVLSTFSSTSAVSSYTITGMMTTALTAILRIAATSMMPGLGGIIGEGDYKRASRLRAEGLLICWGTGTVAAFLVLTLNHSFVSLWVGSRYYAGTLTNLLLCFIMLQFIFLYLDSLIVDLALDLKKKTFLSFLVGAFSILLASFWIPRYGILGLCCSLFVGRFPLLIAYPQIVHSILGKTKSLQATQWFRRTAISSILFVIGMGLEVYLKPKSWSTLLLLLTLVCLFGATFVFVFGLSAYEKINIRARFVGLLTVFQARNASH